MLWSIILDFIQHGLTSIGAVVVAKGLASSSDTTTAVGAIVTLIGFGHSLYEKWSSQNPPSSSPPTPGPRIPVLLFAVASIAATCCFSGCKSTPQQVTYQAAGTAVVTVDTAMNLWGAYVTSNHPGTNEEMAVESAYDKYQAAMAVVCDAGAAYAATGGTNATATAALDQAIANSSQDLTDLETVITTFGVQLQ